MTFPNSKWQAGTGKQVILKSDFVDIENAILTQSGVRLNPPLVLVDTTTIRVAADPSSPAAMQLTGFPNVLNPATMVSGGLCDGKARTVTANVSLIITSGGIWGTEKYPQIYAVFAMALAADTAFTLKAMPYMRAKSQSTKTIKCGTLVTPATGINYAFTDDELAGSKLYWLTGANRGKMLTVTINRVNTETEITYSETAVTVTAGDVFIILPRRISSGGADASCRLVGHFYNNILGNIEWVSSVNYFEPIHYITSGTHPFIVPPWIYCLKEIICIGGGAGGGGAGFYAGGGAVETYGHYPVLPGAYYEVIIALGGAGGGNSGGTSSFGTLPHAHGGGTVNDPAVDNAGGVINTDGCLYRVNHTRGENYSSVLLGGSAGGAGFYISGNSTGAGNIPGGGGGGNSAGAIGAVYITV